MSYFTINRVVLVGRLTRDPELRSLPSGDSVCGLRIACNGESARRRRRAAASGRTTSTSASSARRRTASARYTRKGSRVGVDGRLEWREWETDEQQRRQAVSIVADRAVPRQPGEQRAGGARRADGDGEDAGERELVGAGAGGRLRARRIGGGDGSVADARRMVARRVRHGRRPRRCAHGAPRRSRPLDAPSSRVGVNWRAVSTSSHLAQGVKCQSTTSDRQDLRPGRVRGRPREDQGVRARGRRDEPAAPRRRGRARGRLRRCRRAADVRGRLQRARRSDRRSSTRRSS